MTILRLCSTLTAFGMLAAAQAAPDLTAPATYAAGGPGGTVVAGDFNGDGLTDLAMADNSILGFQICSGAPGNLFSSPVPRSVGFIVGPTVAADVNNDGLSDLAFIVSLSLGVVKSLPGGGHGGVEFIAGGHATPTHLAAGDFNKDGLKDLIVAGSSGFSYLRNLGGGAYAPPVMLPQLSPGSYVMVGDYNNDGNLDFVGTAGLTSYSYAGNGAGGFALPFATAAVSYGAAMADFNGDGKLDIVHTTVQPRQDGSNQAIAVSVGQGTGSFINQYSYVLNTPFGQPAVGDSTGDGKPDVAVYVNATASLRVYPGNGAFGVMLSAPYTFDAGPLTGGLLTAADLDGNGSKDLIFTASATHRIYRNTHGNPPLLAEVKLTPASVVGGTAVNGTVILGGAAPAAGATVTLVSSDPSLVSFPAGNTINIPPGSASAAFSILTSAVAAPASVTVSATSNGVTTAAQLNVVAPFALAGFAVSPDRQYGIFTVPGTLALSGAADSAASISLTSSNTAVATVPATINVPAGAASVIVPITLRPVTVDTPVTISASLGGITRTATITVLRPLDAVTVSKAILTQKTAQLKVEATGTNAAATLTVHHHLTGALIGTLINRGGGKYDGTMTAYSAMTSMTLKSSFGGTVTSAVQVK